MTTGHAAPSLIRFIDKHLQIINFIADREQQKNMFAKVYLIEHRIEVYSILLTNAVNWERPTSKWVQSEYSASQNHCESPGQETKFGRKFVILLANGRNEMATAPDMTIKPNPSPHLPGKQFDLIIKMANAIFVLLSCFNIKYGPKCIRVLRSVDIIPPQHRKQNYKHNNGNFCVREGGVYSGR